MKIVNAFFLVLFSIFFVAFSHNTAIANQTKSSTGKGIVKYIDVKTIKIGGQEYSIHANLKCYNDWGGRIALSEFKKGDGVQYKLNSKGVLYFLKKIPR